MSLWTPDGERPVERGGGSSSEEGVGYVDLPDDLTELTPEERVQYEAMQREMDEVRQSLLEAPAAVVVANHAMGIYELAAIHLTAPEPKLADASLAIDALGQLVEGLAGRLGEPEETLRGALAQLRTAYLEVAKALG